MRGTPEPVDEQTRVGNFNEGAVTRTTYHTIFKTVSSFVFCFVDCRKEFNYQRGLQS